MIERTPAPEGRNHWINCDDSFDLMDIDLEKMDLEGLRSVLRVVMMCTDCEGCDPVRHEIEAIILRKIKEGKGE